METGILAIISLITLIVFFVISVNIGNIRKNVQSMQRMMKKEAEFYPVHNCKKCGKDFKGRVSFCPHCGDKKQWDE